MPWYLLGGSSVWVLINWLIFQARYPNHTANGADVDYHVIMTIVGIVFIAIISMIMDCYWFSERKSHSTTAIVLSFLGFLGLIIVMAIVIANLRFITGIV